MFVRFLEAEAVRYVCSTTQKTQNKMVEEELIEKAVFE